MKTKKVRNGKIDFMKFLFAFIIVIHHSRNLVGDDVSPFFGGSFAVEFFFIVSGYLFLRTILKAPDNTSEIGKETKNLIEQKQKKELNFTILSIETIEKNCYIIVE